MANIGVMSTNDDATTCKSYAVSKKYWNDNFIQYFIKNTLERRTPEINRGYYIRHKCVANIINQFLTITNRECQIISFGAGFDTMYWNLYEQNMHPKHGFYEVDLPQVVQRKCYCIRSREQLKKYLIGSNVIINKDEIKSDFYQLFSADITKIFDLDSVFKLKKIDKDVPTLFLTECVMVYISIENGKHLFNYIASNFPTVLYAEYDPICLTDRFGDIMKQNLRNRQCNLLGLHPDINSKMVFFNEYFKSVQIKLMIDVYREIDCEEKRRVEKLEFFDEIELLDDLLKHYSITCSYNDHSLVGLSKIKL